MVPTKPATSSFLSNLFQTLVPSGSGSSGVMAPGGTIGTGLTSPWNFAPTTTGGVPGAPNSTLRANLGGNPALIHQATWEKFR